MPTAICCICLLQMAIVLSTGAIPFLEDNFCVTPPYHQVLPSILCGTPPYSQSPTFLSLLYTLEGLIEIFFLESNISSSLIFGTLRSLNKQTKFTFKRKSHTIRILFNCSLSLFMVAST